MIDEFDVKLILAGLVGLGLGILLGFAILSN